MVQTLATPGVLPSTPLLSAPQAEHQEGADNAFRAAQLGAEQGAADPEDDGALESVVRALSPTLADLLDRGVAGVYGEELSGIIEARVAELLDSVELGSTVEGGLGGAVATVVGVAAGDQGCCTALQGWIGAMTGGVAELIGGGSIEAATGGLEQWREGPGSLVVQLAAQGVSCVADEIAPGVTGALSSVSGAIARVAAVDQGAADWVSAKVGLGDAEGGMAMLLAELWDSLVGAVQGAFGAAIDGVLDALFALPGTEQVYRLVDVGFDLVEAASFLSDSWRDPSALLDAPEALADNLFQGFVVGGLEAVAAARVLADGWAVAGPVLLEQLSVAIDTALGVPVLGALTGVLTELHTAISWVVESPLWGELASALEVFARFGADVLVAFVEVLTALPLAGNPVGLLAIVTSEGLQLLPDCYKAPVFDALITLACQLVDAGLQQVLLGVGGSMGPSLAEAVHPSVVAVLGELTGRSTEEKATVLEQVAKMLSPEAAVEFVLGLGAGLVGGAFAEIRAALGLLEQIGSGARDLLVWLGTRGPVAMGMVADELAGLAGAALGAIDAAGDRHFEGDGPQAAAPEPRRDPGGLAEALQGVIGQAQGLFAVAGVGLRDPEELAELFHGLWAGLVDATARGAAAAAGAALDTFLLVGGALSTAGSVLGNVVSSLFLDQFLAGAGSMARGIPLLADLLRGLRLLLAAPDVAVAAIAAPLRGLLGQIGPFLRSLGNPLADGLLDALEDLGRAVDGALEPLHRRVRAAEDPERGAQLDQALERAAPEVRGLVDAARRVGDADLAQVAEDVLLALDRELHGDLAEQLLEDATVAAREELDSLLLELALEGGSAALPEWYDPDATAWQNVSRCLVARVVARLSEPEPETDPGE